MRFIKTKTTMRWASLAWAVVATAASAAAPVDISSLPLYSRQQAHPNVAVTLSVEFPTVGTAFNDPSVRNYDRAVAYLGYFDATKCYSYVPGTPGYFTPRGPADANHECSNQFSGSFMNYLTMSAIDEFRYAITGGNRVVDPAGTSGATVERARLPDGTAGVDSFYDSDRNFPLRVLQGSALTTYHSRGAYGATSPSLLQSVLPSSIGLNTDAVYIHNCQSKIFFGDGGGSCQSPDATRGAFDVRIAMCGPGAGAEGETRTDLCFNYGTASAPIYKPVGEAQRNAANVRFASFGYLMDRNPPSNYCGALVAGADWNRCRYGGVLRSPMKYLGATNFDANLNPSPNPNREINADGTFVVDPEGSAIVPGGFSGFINYVNKFGSATGTYKTFDPMGEQYYEAVRYFQNLGPTAAAYDPAPSASLSVATMDSFPVVSRWTDPILARCAANYIINVADTNTWDDTYLPGYSGSPSAGYGRPASRPIEGGLDAVLWTQKAGDLEATMPSLGVSVLGVGSGDVEPSLSGIESRGTGTIGTASYFPVGVAYWANTNDIRSDREGVQTVKTISVDVAETSNSPMTFQQRQLFLMGKYGGFTNTKDRTVDGTQQNPFYAAGPLGLSSPAIRSNSEWLDANNNPTNYLLASDPKRLIDGLRAAFARIGLPSGTAAGASLTSANLIYGGAGAYVGSFKSARWSGNVLLKNVSLDPLPPYDPVVTDVPTWDPAARLDDLCGPVNPPISACLDTTPPSNGRNVVTTIGTPGARSAVNFVWSLLDTPYQDALNLIPGTVTSDGNGQQRLNYLRGYRADEASPLAFRPRDSALGDIVNSGPTYVGAPTTNVPDPDYEAFYSANKTRPAAVYVGSNDGMLHAFNATAPTLPGGNEYFAYVPGYSKDDLNALTNPGYLHKTFVDTTPKIQEARVGPTKAWKTVLVGANGGGAQGVFALDVTHPETFGPSNVLFEFSDADDPDFGSVLAAPEIAKLQVGVTSASVPIYEYFVVVTGYNESRTTVNGRTDTRVSSATPANQGFLFLLSLKHQLPNAWIRNVDYFKYSFPAAVPGSRNGLGPVTLLPSRTGDRSTAALYFGDLQGQLWRFNTAVGSTAPITPANYWKPALGTLGSPIPIFNAHDDAGNRQPITARPELSNGPFPNSTMLFFGTGAYLGETDITGTNATARQSQYAILDLSPSTAIVRSTNPSTSDLVRRTATLSAGSVNVSGTAFNYSGAGSKKGWYMDFPSSADGERSINKPAVRTGLLTFDTLTLAGDVCGAGGGYIYQLGALTGLEYLGTPAGFASTVGIPGPPQIVDLGRSDGSLRVTGEQVGTQRQTTMVGGTKGTIDSTRDTGGAAVSITSKAPPIGRVSWREISNWNDKTNH